MERITMLGLADCVRLANATAEVVVATAIGPRILRYALRDGENILAEIPDEGEQTSYGLWKPWGGHRLWAAPEAMPRTYVPDNGPIEAERRSERSIGLRGEIEKETGLRKEMLVTLDEEGSGVTIIHTLTNHGVWPVRLAPWALTIVRGGGTTILPQEPFRSHDDYLLPARPMVLWYFTDLSDPRWRMGAGFIRLSTDTARSAPQKIGIGNRQGWTAYHRDATLFVKRFAAWEEGACYADFGSNNEAYTAGDFMEIESLGPLRTLEPGASVEHRERWHLFDGVTLGKEEVEIARMLAPFLERSADEG